MALRDAKSGFLKLKISQSGETTYINAAEIETVTPNPTTRGTMLGLVSGVFRVVDEPTTYVVRLLEKLGWCFVK